MNVDEVAASELHEFVNNVSAFFFDMLLVQETGSLCPNDFDHTKHVVSQGSLENVQASSSTATLTKTSSSVTLLIALRPLLFEFKK